jgi:hypothetical protein
MEDHGDQPLDQTMLSSSGTSYIFLLIADKAMLRCCLIPRCLQPGCVEGQQTQMTALTQLWQSIPVLPDPVSSGVQVPSTAKSPRLDTHMHTHTHALRHVHTSFQGKTDYHPLKSNPTPAQTSTKPTAQALPKGLSEQLLGPATAQGSSVLANPTQPCFHAAS